MAPLKLKRTKALIAGAVFALNLATAVWTSRNVETSRMAHERVAEVSARNLAAAVDTSVSDLTDQINLALLTSTDYLESHLSGRNGIDDANLNELLERQRSRLAPVVSLRVSNAGGQVLYGTGVDRGHPASWANVAVFLALKADPKAGLVVSEPFIGTLSKRPIVGFARRYSNGDGSFAGIVSASVSVEYFQKLLSRLDVGPHGVAVLRDSQYGLIARIPEVRQESGKLGASYISKDLKAVIESGAEVQTFRSTSPTDNIERISVYRRLKNAPFHVVAGLGSEDYLTEWRADTKKTFVYWSSFALCTVLGSVLVFKAFRRAERTAEYKARFLANMSHEIRTPMNAVIGLLSLARSPGLTERQRNAYLDKMDGAAKALLGLLNNILDYSKMEAEMMVMERRGFSLEDLLRRLSSVISAHGPVGGPQVLFDIDADVPSFVHGDELRLQQVLINLGGNAVKFTQRGHVIVALKVISRHTSQVELEFSVEDSGIGIHSTDLPRIFSGFSQGESSTTRRFGGTGLGLSISRRLVELMGGDLRVESEFAKGSRFSFSLKFGAPEPEPPLDSSASGASGIRRALVIDPDDRSRHVTQKAFEGLGWEVKGCSSADEILQQLASGEAAPFDLICVDSSVPSSASRALNSVVATSQRDGSKKPVFVETLGRGALASSFEAAIGPLCVVSKPFTPKVLADALEAAAQPPGSRIASGAGTRQARLSKLRLLVVEDNQLNQQVAEELLAAEGAIVCLAANGQAGVEALRSPGAAFDLVLMDMQMPVMDGLQATSYIRENLRLEVPIVAMTANTAASDQEACLEVGMNDHVGKPFDIDQLVAVVLRWARPDKAPAVPGDSFQVKDDLSQGRATSPEYSGVRVAIPTAVARMGGSSTLHARALKMFLQNLQETLENLESHLRGDQSGDALRVIHTLKSTAAVVGAESLAETCSAIELRWKSLKGFENWTSDLEQLRNQASGSVRVLSDASDAAPA